MPVSGIGLVLGIIGFIVAKAGQKSGSGFPVAGSAVSLLGLGVSVAWLTAMTYLVKDVDKAEVNKGYGRRSRPSGLNEEKRDPEGPATAVTALELNNQYRATPPGGRQVQRQEVWRCRIGTVKEVNRRAARRFRRATTSGNDGGPLRIQWANRDSLLNLPAVRSSPSAAVQGVSHRDGDGGEVHPDPGRESGTPGKVGKPGTARQKGKVENPRTWSEASPRVGRLG